MRTIAHVYLIGACLMLVIGPWVEPEIIWMSRAQMLFLGACAFALVDRWPPEPRP